MFKFLILAVVGYVFYRALKSMDHRFRGFAIQ